MAAAPPPYSPRDARQQARDYARAQRDQWRAQRQYYRNYWRAYRKPSFIGPLVLVAIGVIAFLIETGKLNAGRFWGWYAHWWPMLLIIIGVFSLLEYFLDRNNPYAGRRSIGGIVFLIIILGSFGWMTRNGHMVGPFLWQFDDNDNNGDFFSWMGEEHANDVQLDQQLSSAKPNISVQNPRGDVTITASTDGQLHVRAHQIVRSSSDNETQKLFDAVKPAIATSNDGATISVPSRNGARVDLTIELPPQAFTTVNTSHGDATVEGLKGGVDVTSSHGDVKFTDIAGDVHARMDHGDFSAHQIGGHAFVDGQVSDATLSEIKGQVVLDGDFFGDTHLEQVKSTVHFHSSRTDIDIPQLRGDLTMNSGDLHVNQPNGPVRIVTRSKDIDVSQLNGDAKIQNSNGDVNVTAIAPIGNIQIGNRTGSVTLSVPSNGSFRVTASTSNDEEVRTDFPLQAATTGGRQTLNGTVGDGSGRVELTTDHGSLELRKGGTELTERPERPEPPEHPEKPEKPERPEPPAGVKHLKAPPKEVQPTEQ